MPKIQSTPHATKKHPRGLTQNLARELVDLLRKNLMYQAPRPVKDQANEAGNPKWLTVRVLTKHYDKILSIITQAGGWDLMEADRKSIRDAHLEQLRHAYGNGTDFDFNGLQYMDLLGMYEELENVREMRPFRKALAAELDSRSHDDLQV